MVALTNRQQSDLDKAVLNYLESRNLTRTITAFKEETNIDAPENPQLDGILEKKWTAVIRLQKKVAELEGQIRSLHDELRAAPAARAAASAVVDWTPKYPPRHSLSGHRSPITRVAFHPVFSLVATASEDATIKIWDWETGEFERTLKGHTREVKDVDFDSRGVKLVSASSDLSVRIWETELWDKPGYGGQSLLGHDHTVSCARFLSTDDFIISASRDKTIKIWEVATRYCVRTIEAHADWVRWVTPSEDNSLLCSCSNDHSARIWDYKSGIMKSELRLHDRQVEVAIFAPTNSHQYIAELTGLSDVPPAPASFVVTGARDNLIMIWEVQSGQHLRTLSGHDGWIRGLVFHPSGKFLLSASDDKHMRIWDLATGRCIRKVEAHSHFVSCIAWGSAYVGGGTGHSSTNGSSGLNGAPEKRRVNVVATGGIDLAVNIWVP